MHVCPPYQVSIVAREAALRDVPGLQAALAELSGKFSDRKMQELNYQVDGEHQPVSQVAAGFLKQAGLQ
jgi:glycine betaine/choline ABC-type transport system substrate-binding protein